MWAKNEKRSDIFVAFNAKYYEDKSEEPLNVITNQLKTRLGELYKKIGQSAKLPEKTNQSYNYEYSLYQLHKHHKGSKIYPLLNLKKNLFVLPKRLTSIDRYAEETLCEKVLEIQRDPVSIATSPRRRIYVVLRRRGDVSNDT